MDLASDNYSPTLRERQFRRRAVVGYLLVIATVAIPSTIALAIAYVATERRDHVGSEYTRDAALAERLRRDSAAIAAAARGFALEGDPAFPETLSLARADFERTVEQLRGRVRDPRGAVFLDEIQGAAAEYDRMIDRLLGQRQDASLGPPTPELLRMFDESVVPPWRRLVNGLDAYVEFKHDLIAPALAESQAAFKYVLVVTGVGLAFAAGLASAFALSSSRSMIRLYRHEREATRVAEEALAARDELLGVVAHDLRSPLGTIALKANMLSSVDGESGRSAASIEKIALRMGHLIQSLLDAAAISGGKFELARGPLAVDELFDELLDMLAVQADAKRVKLRAESPPGLTLDADHERLIEALMNLIDNAIKFTPSGGEIVVTARPHGDEIWISVRDTGPGISPEHRPHVFERFWKARASEKRGSGLGLFIAQEIVKAHGGRIWVDSKLGAGTRFTLALSRAPEPPVPRRHPDGPQARA